MVRLEVLAILSYFVYVSGSNSTSRQRNVQVEPRFLFGNYFSREKIPYFVSLRQHGLMHSCGGSIIDAYWVLTAAHCLSKKAAKDITVVAGITELNADDGQEREVLSISMYPYYKGERLNSRHDIGLIKVKRPFLWSSSVQQVRIGKVALNEYVFVAGMGQNSGARLKLVKMMTADCGFNKYLLICLKVKNRGPCNGDYGGPVVNSRGEQVGIVAYGYGNCSDGLPEMLTRVEKYLSWITYTTRLGISTFSNI